MNNSLSCVVSFLFLKKGSILSTIAVDLRPLIPEHDGIPALQDHEGSVQALFAEAFALDHLAAQGGEAGAPADGQATLELGLDARDFFVELAAALVRPLVDGVHGTAEEEPDGLVDVLLRGHGGERELR